MDELILATKHIRIYASTLEIGAGIIFSRYNKKILIITLGIIQIQIF